MGINATGKKRQPSSHVQKGKRKHIKTQAYENKVENNEMESTEQQVDEIEEPDLLHHEDSITDDESSPDNVSVNSGATDEEMTESNNTQKEITSEPEEAGDAFRNVYMANITAAFGSDLDKIRQEPTFNVQRLGILIDSLEAGIDIFSEIEKDIILSHNKSGDTNE